MATKKRKTLAQSFLSNFNRKSAFGFFGPPATTRERTAFNKEMKKIKKQGEPFRKIKSKQIIKKLSKRKRKVR